MHLSSSMRKQHYYSIFSFGLVLFASSFVGNLLYRRKIESAPSRPKISAVSPSRIMLDANRTSSDTPLFVGGHLRLHRD